MTTITKTKTGTARLKLAAANAGAAMALAQTKPTATDIRAQVMAARADAILVQYLKFVNQRPIVSRYQRPNRSSCSG